MAFREETSSSSKLQKHRNERDGIGGGERKAGKRGERERERGGGVGSGGCFEGRSKDISRSHMVVEMVLYGCVCLSVPFRIFTGKCRRPSVCNNMTPSLPPSAPLSLPSTTVSPSVFLFLCYPRDLLCD